jgi:hypothetical protein
VAMTPQGKVFDSSLDKGNLYEFRFGTGTVIPGERCLPCWPCSDSSIVLFGRLHVGPEPCLGRGGSHKIRASPVTKLAAGQVQG